MYPVIYFIIGCAVLGAIGMAVANTKVDAQTKHNRWVKYFSYLIITTVVIVAILNDFLYWLAGIIIIIGLYELTKALRVSPKKNVLFETASAFIYIFIAGVFVIFPTHFTIEFQFAVYLQVLIFDAFSQITGQIFGKNLLVPAISPTKTIEGFIGGSCFCLITAMAVSGVLEISLVKALLLGVITALSAFAGDLLASWFKRKTTIKDFSKLLPGQGGVLDRFDSFIVSCFVYFSLSQVTGNFLSGFVY